jgi:hypothetical protein
MSQPAPTEKTARQPPRTAVVVVHGIGSQRVRETLRGLVDALWTHDPDIKNAGATDIWIRPSSNAELFDLATVTTAPVEVRGEKRAFEFHEFYWAHLLSDTKWVAVLLWAFDLMRKGRPPEGDLLRPYWGVGAIILALLVVSVVTVVATVALQLAAMTHVIWEAPLTTTRAWQQGAALVAILLVSAGLLFFLGKGWGLLAWLVALALAFVAALLIKLLGVLLFGAAWIPPSETLAFFGELLWTPLAPWAVVASIVVLCGYALVDAAFLTPYFGDVARYLRPSPANVRGRENIQECGVRLLRSLQDSGRFDRIVIVAHSLGSVVAYDVLKDLFARAVSRLRPIQAKREFTVVDTFPDGSSAPGGPTERAQWRHQWRASVRALSREAALVTTKTADGSDRAVWLISDLVTLGSPLTHARFLMTSGRTWTELNADFRRRCDERDFPLNPPPPAKPEPEKGKRLSYVDRVTGETRIHHAALFGFVRWSNLYFRARGATGADFIGGPLSGRDHFGEGIEDIVLTERVATAERSFAHLWYWALPTDGGNAHLLALQRAADLLEKSQQPL